MINVIDEKMCCGCGGCSVACPKHCIEMRKGTLGHLFPFVDSSACVNCGKCESVCPMLQKRAVGAFRQTAYASYAKEEKRRFEGSSGGMFGTFAHQLLKQGFIVYGAAFDEALQLKCTVATNEAELVPLLKSKYLQSSLNDSFAKIESELKAGKKILFVSTPCQIVALKSYLGKPYEQLITIDFFCHGVPSQAFFDACIQEDSKRLGGNIRKYEFRTKKKNGATPHYFSAEIETGSGTKRITDIYYKSSSYAIFQQYINLRESCYSCVFAGADRVSDITIGDFHEIDQYINGINRFDGVSTVIINSRKGDALWSLCRDQVVAYPIDLNTLIADGICFSGGTKRPANRDEFISDYEKKSFSEVIHKYANPKRYRKQGIYYALPKSIRKIIKKRLGV